MPESVIAHTHNVALKNEIEVEDTAFGLFKMKNGTNFVLMATNSASATFPIYYMFKADGHTVQLSSNNILIDGEHMSKSDNIPLFGKEVWGVGHVGLIKEFYTCLKTGKKFPIDFYEGSKVIKLILSMYKSNGERIEII